MSISNCGTTTTNLGREKQSHGTAMFPFACYWNNLTDNPVLWHWHDELEALVVAKGKVLFEADQKQVELKAGEGIVVNAGLMHAVWNAGTECCYIRSIVFHPRLLGGTAESVIWQKYLTPLMEHPMFCIKELHRSEDVERRMLEYIKKAWQLCAEEPKGFELHIRNELSELLLCLQSIFPGTEQPISERRNRREERMKIMLHYIQKHLSEEFSVRDIAKTAAVSESECTRCFRTSIGVSPIQYAKQLRLHEAANLLSSTTLKVSEIGDQCGFREMNYFAKSFRERYGMTPTEYRRNRHG